MEMGILFSLCTKNPAMGCNSSASVSNYQQDPPLKYENIHFFLFYMNWRENFFISFLVFSGHETVIINGLNYFKTGSAQSKHVKQPTKLIFLLKLDQLFLSLTQLSPSLLLNFLKYLAREDNIFQQKVYYTVSFIKNFPPTHISAAILAV